MVRAVSARTDWFRGIPLVKVGRVDRVPAEDAGERAAEQAAQVASVDPAEVVAELLAEHLAECSEAEEAVVVRRARKIKSSGGESHSLQLLRSLRKFRV